MPMKKKYNISEEGRRNMSKGGRKGGKKTGCKGFAYLKKNSPDRLREISLKGGYSPKPRKDNKDGCAEK